MKIKKNAIDNSITNTHDGHVASCLCCSFFYAEDEYPGYSEMTPGSPASIECTKGVADFNLYNIQTTFQQIHDLGSKCKLFQAKAIE